MAIDFSSINPGMSTPSPSPTTQGDNWTCSCGTVNTGRFCVSCGGPKPAASAPTPAPAPASGGFSLNLSKGMTLDLTKRNPGLSKIKAGLGWDVAVAGGSNFDLDVAALLCHGGKIHSGNDVVFFNNLSQPGVQLMGDNRTGAGDGDDEVINVDLSAVAPDVDKIVFIVTIYYMVILSWDLVW